MATGQLSGVVGRLRRHFRRAVLVQDGGGMTDGQLLECFVARRDEAAFEALVRRHGPMVLGVCRRLVGHSQDAEDAFQATFLVLVRKATSIGQRELVGNWLYGTAYRAGLEVKAARRRAKERQVSAMPEPVAIDDADAGRELRPVLDQELNRLPDKYRVPVVLCDLEGRTRRDVARQLGIPEGTLSGRLTTARRKLAKRLGRHGVTLSAGALAMLLAPNAASASLPASLVVSTVQAAALLAAGKPVAAAASAHVAAITEGVLNAMLMTKLKVTAAFLIVIGLLAVGSGALGYSALADPAADQPPAAAEQPRTPEAADGQGTQDKPREQSRGGTTVAGRLEGVDAEKNNVTISTFNRQAGVSTDKTYPLAKDAKSLRDGKEAKPADLKKGGRATLTLSADQKAVVAVSVVGGTTQVALKSIDAEKNTVTFTAETRQGKVDRTLQVAKDAKVTLEGKEAKLADVKAGTVVVLTFSADDANTVIQIQTPRRRGQDGEE